MCMIREEMINKEDLEEISKDKNQKVYIYVFLFVLSKRDVWYAKKSKKK